MVKERLLEDGRKLDGSQGGHDDVGDEQEQVDKVKDAAYALGGLSMAPG